MEQTINTLDAISPLDGRYASKTSRLRAFTSEHALIYYRVLVEVNWFKFLAAKKGIPELPALNAHGNEVLDKLIHSFSKRDSEEIKELEAKTNHDVKAVEYFLKSRFLKSNFKTSNQSAHNIAYPNTGLLKEINNNQSFEKITHLHWLGDNTISIEEVGKLKGPIFWTLHDQWPFCGAEHYTHPPFNKEGLQINDFRYRQNYSSKSRIFDEKGFDLNRWTWQRKKRSCLLYTSDAADE